MSQASALALIQRLASDQEFAKKIMAVPDVGARIRLAAEAGYEVSAEELAVRGEYLGESDLASIAGAADTFNPVCPTDIVTCET